MTDSRPDPDALLERVARDEPERARGRLKIFFGAVAGVGKTYAMLEAARERLDKGEPVLVGVVETHGRRETQALLEGLEVLPRKRLEYRGHTLEEFDLDAALARRPALILVDELAHTNAPGSRHVKRWQDVEELIAAGIDVWTTLNVQHLESLNDVVAQVTSVPVRETVPDSVFESADDVELVDLPTDELLHRLSEGKVYMPDVVGRALERFFRKGNLIALRELALRATAERVDAQMELWRRTEGERTWPVAERLLVCISSSPSATQLVRAGRRMAAKSRAEWIVVWVDTPRQQGMPAREREHAAVALRLAERLGAEAVTLDGQDATEEILAYARRRNATRIVVGKPGRYWWSDRLRQSFVERLIRESGDIDVTVVRATAVASPAPPPVAARRNWRPWVKAALIVALCTLVARAMFPAFERSNLVMVYLLGVVIAAVFLGRGPAALAAMLSVAAFDFFFVPPHLTFAVADTQYVVTFAVMLVVGLVIGTLTARVREQAEAARRREQETVALYALSRELAGTRGAPAIARLAAGRIAEVFGSPVALLLPDEQGLLRVAAAAGGAFPEGREEAGVAEWTHRRGVRAGWGTDTLPGARALYMPLATAAGSLGVAGLAARGEDKSLPPADVHLLEAFANQVATALERERLAAEADAARLRAEAERMQSALLSSLSHDLRTPLASITGAASTLLESSAELPPEQRRGLTEAILDESDRLSRLVGNLLDMTRLAAGSVEPAREWQSIEELVGAAIARAERRVGPMRITTDIPSDLPLVSVDGVLIEQLLLNLLDNAARYGGGSPIDVRAEAVPHDAPREVTVEVGDRGPGLAPGEELALFDKFRRGHAARESQGTGLGLAICRGIVEAHGGRIEAANRPGGGALFRFSLPLPLPLPVPGAGPA